MALGILAHRFYLSQAGEDTWTLAEHDTVVFTDIGSRCLRLLLKPLPNTSQDGPAENVSPASPLPQPRDPVTDPDADMEETTAEASLLSSADQGKRVTVSPASSPTKLPSAKKQHGASLSAQASDHHNPLPAFPAADVTATEVTLKAMLLSLQAGLLKELRMSITI